MKSSLKIGLPNVSTLKLFGICHLMYPDSSKSRHVLSILPDQAGSDQMNSLSDALIDEIRGDIFKQVRGKSPLASFLEHINYIYTE